MRILLISFLAILFSSCQEEVNNNKDCSFTINLDIGSYDLNSIGVNHNLFLEHNISTFNDSNISTTNKEEFLQSFYTEIANNSDSLQYDSILITSNFVFNKTKSALIDDYIFEDLTNLDIRFVTQLNLLFDNDFITLDEKNLIEEFWISLNNNSLQTYDFYKTQWCNANKNITKGIISGAVISVGFNSLSFWSDYQNQSLDSEPISKVRAAPFVVAAADTAGALEGAATYAITNGITGFNDGLGGELLEGGVAILGGAAVSSVAGWFKAVKWAKKAWDWF